MSFVHRMLMAWPLTFVALGFLFHDSSFTAGAENFHVSIRSRVEHEPGQGHRLQETRETWQPSETAIIVCDMWDQHWCQGATRRVGKLVPTMNRVLETARDRGTLIIHAPSGCMNAYEETPARERARKAKKANNLPTDIAGWCKQIPPEEKGIYPVDQTDGGCDCQPHCRTYNAWKSQHAGLKIHDADAVSDSGIEIWNLLEAQGIKHVILMGVHTNMCVLGRPFGLRQLSRHGRQVVLMRDMTDTMYNHESWPFVDHFRGNDLVVEHIEKFVAGTITSDQLLGGEPFRFVADRRPHVAFLIGEDEYDTKHTLPRFADEELKPWNVPCTMIHASTTDANSFPEIEKLKEADLLVLSVRRRTPPADQLKIVREFLAAGKPVIGIRTANHAFALRNHQPAPQGHEAWPELDAELFGGNYQGHHGGSSSGQPLTRVELVPARAKHALLAGIASPSWTSPGTLYKVRPVASDAHVVVTGSPIAGGDPEPVAWKRETSNSRVFYTSLGHPADFKQPAFRRLLTNAIFWASYKPGTADDIATK